MKPFVLSLALLVGFSMPSVTCGQESLSVAHLSSWTIVVAADALPSEQYAAEEFRSLFKQISGTELAIANDPAGASGNIYIGSGKPLSLSSVAIEVSDLGEEGLRYKVAPDNIAIAGGRPRGTLYGVYEFFERVFDVRFLTFDHTSIPADAATRLIPSGEVSYTPPFSFRWPYYKENADHPDFAARLRVNTVSDDPRLGAKTNQHLINHSLMRLCPVEKYGQEHPEYFALVNGERKLEMGGGGPELCVSNPNVVDVVTQAVIADLDANPNQQNFSVSQNDNDAHCECDNCKAIDEREGTPMGSYMQFLNQVAERVEQKHPNVKIGSLAYWYTRKAPKTLKPRDNIQIQLCSIECCTLHPINDPNCERNREFCQDVAEWKQLCKDIWIWNYNTDFSSYDLPFPNLRVIGPNIRYFRENNAKGIFMQANGNGNSGEMCDLRNYLIARLLWNPDLDDWALVEEFCRLHYREAAQPILDYLVALHDNAEAKGVHPGCFPVAHEVGLDQAMAGRALAYFEEALQKAPSEEVRARVEKASICAYKAMLEVHSTLVYQDGKARLAYPSEHPDIFEKYVDLSHKHNLTMAAETKPIDDFIAQVRPYAEGVPALAIENESWRLVCLPEDNGKVTELTYLPTGRNLVEAPNRSIARQRAFEEWGLWGYDHEKAMAFSGEKVDDHTLRLTKKLEDGTTLTREIALVADPSPKVSFLGRISQAGEVRKEYELKIHPEYNAGTVSEDATILSAYIKGDKWVRFNDDWKTTEGPLASLLQSEKAGQIAFFNHEAGYGVLQTYQPEKIDQPKLWWSGSRSLIDLELLTERTMLEPGQTFEYRYEVSYLDAPPDRAEGTPALLQPAAVQPSSEKARCGADRILKPVEGLIERLFGCRF